jgi:uncharacterized protein with HEPN domain
VKRSVQLRLHDMLDAIEGIEATVGEAGFAAYARNWTMRRAVERGIEIISEASRHLPDELKAHYPQVYWQEIAAIGNLLRHDYGRVDDRIMWRVVEKYLPELKDVVLDMQRRSAPAKERGGRSRPQ